jgi:hypothetical protein
MTACYVQGNVYEAYSNNTIVENVKLCVLICVKFMDTWSAFITLTCLERYDTEGLVTIVTVSFPEPPGNSLN